MPRPDPGKIMKRLARWAGQDGRDMHEVRILDGHFDLVSRTFDLHYHEIMDLIGDDFSPLFAFIMEDFLTDGFDDADEGSAVGNYLDRHGWREDIQSRRYLEELEVSTPALYEVCELEPEGAIVIRDLMMGSASPATVANSGMPDGVRRGDCLAGRLLDVDGELCLATGVLLYSREMAHEALAALAAASDRHMEQVDQEVMRSAEEDASDITLQGLLFLGQMTSRILTEFWLANALIRVLADMPRLRNSDGEEIRFSDIRFPLRADVAEVAAVLDQIDVLGRREGEEGFWTWRSLNPSKAPMPQHAKEDADPGPVQLTSESSIGVVSLEPGALVLGVNSEERAKRGRDLLASRLGRLAGRPRTRRRDPIRAYQKSLR